MKLVLLLAFAIFIASCNSQRTTDNNPERKTGKSAKELKNEGIGKSNTNNNVVQPKKNDGINSAKNEATQKSKRSKVRNILAVFAYQGKSHHLFLQKIIKILLDEGHNVTTFTTFPMEENYANHKQIIYKPIIASWTEIFEFERMTYQTGRELRVDLEVLSESFMFPLYRLEEFKQLLNGKDEFDLVVLETFFMQEPLIFLGHRFNCPVVTLATAVTETNQDLYMGRVKNPAVEREWTTYSTDATMNFYQRAVNTFSWMVNILEHRFYYVPKREADFFSMVSYPGIESLPPLQDMLHNVSLTLANSHNLVQFPTAQTPNHILVPGLHITGDTSLPQELASLMDNAKDGVVLLVMGTMVPVSKMKGEREIFIKAFSKLRQLVLWRSDIDIPNLPKNILTYKWIPQQAVLAHKNCLAFISHGGMLSKQEALYYGVPIVTIPLFGDQPSNAGHSQITGLGVTLEYNSLTVESLHNAITTVIYDKQYSERLDRYSQIFREAVSQSRSTARYWLDHVMNNDGAAYLRHGPTDLYWFQYFLLDVFAVFLLIMVVSVVLLIKCAQGFYRLRFPVKVQNTKIKKQ